MTALIRPHSRTIIREDQPQPVTDALKGRVVERLLRVGPQLLIRCADGTEVRLSWRDERGRAQGTPYLDNVGCWR